MKLIRVFALLIAMTAMIVAAPIAAASPVRQDQTVLQSETFTMSASDQEQQESMSVKNKIAGVCALVVLVGYGIVAARRSYRRPSPNTRR